MCRLAAASSRRLLLEFLEQARVLDGDRRLRGEGLQQADRIVGKGANALAPHDERADHLVLMQERYGEQRAYAGLQVQLEQRVSRRLGQIVDLHGLAALGTLADQGVTGTDRMLPHGGDQVLAHVVAGLQVELAAHRVVHVDRAAAGVGELAGVGKNRIQHHPQVERRGDRAADLAERLQLAHRARQLAGPRLHLVEQAHVLDRDHRLVGELLQQLFLGLRHRSSLGPADDDDAERLALAQHRHAQHAAPAHGRGKSLIVVRIGQRVLQSDHRPGEDGSSGYLGRVGPHRVLGPKQLDIVRAHVVAGDEMEQLAIEAEHVRKHASAESDSVAHDRLEHRLHVGRRGADHAKYRGSCRLLLQCLSQLARARLHLVEQAHVLDRDDRLIGEGRHELDLPVGEGPDIRAGQGHDADRNVLPQHRDPERRAIAAKLSGICERCIPDRLRRRRRGRPFLLSKARPDTEPRSGSTGMVLAYSMNSGEKPYASAR